jgi:hypothetical protein
MPLERQQDIGLQALGLEEADGVLVRPIGGQIYLVEEGSAAAPWDEEAAPDRLPLSGLINRH